ncbi:MAG: response regulator [Bdellovibrionales bacterium]|nr:response regulator [Bdellovibrionales bacterium]
MSKKNLLIVDDDSDYVYVVKRCLQKWPNVGEIMIAENGKVALDIIENGDSNRSRPDIVLLDLNMPVMSGEELLDELDQKWGTEAAPKTPEIFVITSSDSPRDRARSESNRFVRRFLMKPVACATLHEHLHAC